MKTIRIAIFIILFCIFPARIVVQWMPLIGFPMVSTAISLIEYACLMYLLYRFLSEKRRSRKSQSYNILYILYWIYNAYIVYYIMINPQMPRDMMAHISERDFDIIISITEMGLLIPIIVNFQKYLNITKFAKASAFFVTIILLLYSSVSDMKMYLYERTLPVTELANFNIADYGMISSLMMGEFCSIAFLFNFSVRRQWSENIIINNIIFIFVAIFLLFLLFLFSQRGPVLFMVLTLLFYYFSKGKIKRTIIIVSILGLVILSLFGDTLSQLISKNDFSLIERFMSIGEDGGSGRFGDENAEYNLAFKQIMQGPLFGSYFRTNVGTRIGDYPHNFVLELLMTFGLVFTIPFILLCWNGIKRSYNTIKNDLPMSAFCLVFLNVYACHLTSYTIASSYNMWLLLAMVINSNSTLNINPKNISSHKNQ